MPQLIRAIRPMFKTNKWRICRDDNVYILSGPDKGKTGRVLEVFKDQRVPKVIVEGRNMRKKKVRTGAGEDDYFVVTMEAPLHYSQVQVADPDTGKPTRVIFMYTPEGKLVRARKVPNPTVNDIIPTPPEEADPRAGLVGPKDTPADLARRGSFVPAQGFPFRVRHLERIWAGLHPDAPTTAGGDDEGPGSAPYGEEADEYGEDRNPGGAANPRGLWAGLRAAGSNIGGGAGSSIISSSSLLGMGSNASPSTSVLGGGPRGLCSAAAASSPGRGDGPDGVSGYTARVRVWVRRTVAAAAGSSPWGGADAPCSASAAAASAAAAAEEERSGPGGNTAAPPQRHTLVASSFALSGLHPRPGGPALADNLVSERRGGVAAAGAAGAAGRTSPPTGPRGMVDGR